MENIQGPDEFRGLLQRQSTVGSETGADQGVEAYVHTASLGKVAATIALFVAFMILAPFVGYLASSLVFLTALSILLWPGGAQTRLAFAFDRVGGGQPGHLLDFLPSFQCGFPLGYVGVCKYA